MVDHLGFSMAVVFTSILVKDQMLYVCLSDSQNLSSCHKSIRRMVLYHSKCVGHMESVN